MFNAFKNFSFKLLHDIKAKSVGKAISALVIFTRFKSVPSKHDLIFN